MWAELSFVLLTKKQLHKGGDLCQKGDKPSMPDGPCRWVFGGGS